MTFPMNKARDEWVIERETDGCSGREDVASDASVGFKLRTVLGKLRSFEVFVGERVLRGGFEVDDPERGVAFCNWGGAGKEGAVGTEVLKRSGGERLFGGGSGMRREQPAAFGVGE